MTLLEHVHALYVENCEELYAQDSETLMKKIVRRNKKKLSAIYAILEDDPEPRQPYFHPSRTRTLCPTQTFEECKNDPSTDEETQVLGLLVQEIMEENSR